MGNGIYSETVGKNLEAIIQESDRARVELKEGRRMIHEAILHRETNWGRLLDIAIQAIMKMDESIERLEVINTSAEQSARLVGPPNKQRPPVDEL